MILKELIDQLEAASHPIAKALHKGEHFRVLAIGFKKDMVLKEHQAHLPSKLFVLKGEVNYLQNSETTTLEQFDEIDIPVNVLHSVEALAESICLLTQG